MKSKSTKESMRSKMGVSLGQHYQMAQCGKGRGKDTEGENRHGVIFPG